MQGVLHAFEWVEFRVAELAALPLLVMMGVVTADVMLRYSFNAPLAWSYDLVSMYLMPAIVFPSLAIVQRLSHHVNVDILYRRFSPAMQRLAGAISLLASGTVLSLIGYLASRRAWIALLNDEVVSGPISWPVWIGPALLAFGAFLFVLRTLAGLIGIAHGQVIAPGSGDSERADSAEGN
jgi:TRAP-type C4-dicarboxylate transport system permease small subunit